MIQKNETYRWEKLQPKSNNYHQARGKQQQKPGVVQQNPENS